MDTAGRPEQPTEEPPKPHLHQYEVKALKGKYFQGFGISICKITSDFQVSIYLGMGCLKWSKDKSTASGILSFSRVGFWDYIFN